MIIVNDCLPKETRNNRKKSRKNVIKEYYSDSDSDESNDGSPKKNKTLSFADMKMKTKNKLMKMGNF